MLSEPQILRYARQILLPQVGGKGQEALLATSVRLSGEGAALMAAAAYLAASGVVVNGRHRRITARERGFVFPANAVGQDAAAELGAELYEINPDARAERAPNVALGELPAGFGVDGAWVALGWDGANGAVVFRTAEGCAACFEATAGELGNGPAGPSALVLGSIGALIVQRLALGMSEPLGGVRVGADGTTGALEVRRCEAHRDPA